MSVNGPAVVGGSGRTVDVVLVQDDDEHSDNTEVDQVANDTDTSCAHTAAEGSRPQRKRVHIVRDSYNLPEFVRSYKVPMIHDVPGVTAAVQDDVKGQLGAASATSTGRNSKNVFSFLLRSILSLFPILKWLPTYKPRTYLMSDVVAGLTVGVMHIPLGIANSILSNLPPIYGLYTSFFPGLVYTIFGTSPHLSIGTLVISCAMLGSIVDRVMSDCVPTHSWSNITANSSENMTDDLQTMYDWSSHCTLHEVSISGSREYVSVTVALTVTMLVGFMQLLMFILRLGFLTIYLSEPVITAFTSAAAIHIASAQLKYLIGVTIPPSSPPTSALKYFRLIGLYKSVIENITTINWYTVLITICSLILLVTAKELHAKYKLRFNIPYDLLLIVIGTTVSYLTNLKEALNVKIVGDIPTGIPAPQLPPPGLFKLIPDVLSETIALCIVIFTMNLSPAKLFEKKHKDLYTVSPNQELLSYSLANILGIPFKCFVSAAGLPRCVALEALGAKTQIAGFLSNLVVLLVLLVLASLLQYVPNAILSVIILVALKNLYTQHLIVFALYKTSKIDCFVWIITWIATIIFTVDIGLYTGVGFAMLTIIYRLQRSEGQMVAQVSDTGVYSKQQDVQVSLSQNLNDETHDLKRNQLQVTIFTFPGVLCYLNIQSIIQHVTEKLANDCTRQRMQNDITDVTRYSIQQDQYNMHSKKGDESQQVLVLDLNSVTSIDQQAVNELMQFVQIQNSNVCNVKMTCINDKILHQLYRNNFFHILPIKQVYPSIHDAVTSV